MTYKGSAIAAGTSSMSQFSWSTRGYSHRLAATASSFVVRWTSAGVDISYACLMASAWERACSSAAKA
jgi:hypothetical protein